MNIEISSGSLWNSSRYFEFKIEIIGAGTIEDPYLISTKNKYPSEYYEIRIYNSNEYIFFNEISLKALYLRHCRNIVISRAIINYLGLGKCSTISIQNVYIKKQLRLDKVQQIKIADSKVNKLFAFSGDQISISNCDIKRISRKSKAVIHICDEKKAPILKNYSNQPPEQLKRNFWTCNYCNSEVDMNSIFCYECGRRLKTNN